MTACGSGGPTPLGASLQSMVSGGPDASSRAEEIPYASLAVHTEHHRGLLILGAMSNGHTYWPSAEGLSLQLHDGGLFATAGLGADLLGTHHPDLETPPWRGEASAGYRIERHVRDDSGTVVRHVGQGTLECAAPSARDLPLATLELERCRERIDWQGDGTTRAELWRDPETRDLWAYDGQAWPGGPMIAWQVARPWW
ncbi:hypothetical protein B0684_06665 [Thioalkalivibrio versutus]|nr:hypothetical protein B0684_06665 [Thioalkalivibrio versutus]